ncbi:hypothetical protein [Novosphingobium sp. B-7]|uniref:hypothetical protein n=1 Tax=Novosphingobium sp. B-7 TaxID=1298855 RepID=UPI0011D2AC8E|nr:hypothetical protein [Novosphingobium sp. B-7]
MREIDEELRTLEAERGKLERLISMATQLMREAGLFEAASATPGTHPRLITKTLEGLSSSDDFPTAVALIVERAEDGATYDEIREALLRSPLGSKLRRSDKGFYHALARAKAKGTMVDYKGYTFTPENLKVFLSKIAAGIKQDKSPPSTSGSPMMEALLDIIARQPGIIAKDAIDFIRGGSEQHNLSPIKNENSAYNAIARLKRRGEIETFGHLERQLRIGPNASDELKRLARAAVVVSLKTNTATSQ